MSIPLIPVRRGEQNLVEIFSAPEPNGRLLVERVAWLSEPFGTRLDIEGNHALAPARMPMARPGPLRQVDVSGWSGGVRQSGCAEARGDER